MGVARGGDGAYPAGALSAEERVDLGGRHRYRTASGLLFHSGGSSIVDQFSAAARRRDLYRKLEKLRPPVGPQRALPESAATY